VVTNNQYPYAVLNNAKKEVIRKSLEIYSPEIAFVKDVGLRGIRRFLKI
jgi:hypothetical protein